MIFFWSDTHFNHAGIIDHCNRGYSNVLHMNEALVARWNSAVEPRDTIYLLGDFGFSHSKLPPLDEYFSRLNGHKHLIVGNHDEKNPKVMKLSWVSISDLRTVRAEAGKVIACHYPLETWKGAHRGYIHAHGHSHGTLKRSVAHRYDVGADVYSIPVSIEGLFWQAAREQFNPADHHGDL